NGVRSISVDSAGNIWIGTYYQLFYALDTDFNTLRTAAAYDSGVISSLASVGQDLYIGGQNLWIGKSGGRQFDELASRYPASRIKDLRVDPLSVGQDPITTLVATENLLLVGYFVGGLDVVDLNTGAVSNVLTAPGGVDLSSIGVSGMVQVADDTWLASFYLYGLVEITIVRTDQAPQVSLRQLSSHETLIGVYQVAKDRFLAVDQKELFIVDRKSDGDYALRKFGAAPVGIIFSVEPDGIGGAYLAIENVGIRHLSQQMLDEARFEPLSLHYVEPYLARKTVWHLLLEDRKLLWATTNNGVYVFDLIQENLVSHITYRDGLPANEFEYGTTSSLITASGEKLFISASGPVSFRAPVQPRDEEVQLTWTDVTVNGESVLDQLERMEAGLSEITLPFSAVSDGVLQLEYGYDDHIKALDANYAIRFSEDGEWLRESSPTITITQQQSWEPVHLEIAMLNTNGAVISAPMRMDISVEPPWYMWWVVDIRVAIPSVLLMSLLLLGVQLRAKRRQQRILARMERDRELMEAEIRGRLREKEIQLREIHHRVGNILSSFASNVRTLRRSANSLETRSTLEQLSARIKVQSAVHMLLQRADSTDINAANMIRQVVAGARDILAERDPRPIDLDLDDAYMTYSKAQYLGLIVNELVTNSYKHGLESTTPSLAQISFKLSDSGAGLLYYRDFGPGVDEAMIDGVMSAPRSEATHGLVQIVAMARELKAEPQIKGRGGLHFSMEVTNKLLRTRELRSESLPP
ncbi:MAG: two-component sensor histidine kinase, partial [Glaciecola sp.]